MKDLEKQIEEVSQEFANERQRNNNSAMLWNESKISFEKGVKSEVAKKYWQQEFPIEAIENLIGLINTPIGRRKYSKDIVGIKIN